MELKILTPSEKIAEASTEEIVAHGPHGEFGVLPGHAHYLTPLTLGPLTYTKGGKRFSFHVEGGYMEVVDETVVVAADHVEPAAHIKPEKAVIESRLKELEGQLGSETLSPEEFERLTLDRDREVARLLVIS